MHGNIAFATFTKLLTPSNITANVLFLLIPLVVRVDGATQPDSPPAQA